MRQWALQDAKARFSELVRLATEHEPQEVNPWNTDPEPFGQG